jgi:hypothetical protein
MVSGSAGSVEMLKNIYACPNRLIYRSDLIQIMINSRWNKFINFIRLLTALNWANITVMIILLVNDLHSHGNILIYGIINLILLLYELVQAYTFGFRNYINFWNIVDMVRSGICLIWIILNEEFSESSFTGLTYAMVIANFLRGLSGFRAFNGTRFYVRLIIRCLLDTIPFLIVFFYTTLAFGMLDWASGLEYRTDQFLTLWRSPFETNMGNFNNNDSPNLNYLYFMLTSVINVIIILNLIISVLGNSYDKFQAEAIEIGSMEMTELILEIEIMMWWRKGLKKSEYLQVCDIIQYEGIAEAWEGRLKAISDIVEKSSRANKTNFDFIKKKLEDIEHKLPK